MQGCTVFGTAVLLLRRGSVSGVAGRRLAAVVRRIVLHAAHRAVLLSSAGRPVVHAAHHSVRGKGQSLNLELSVFNFTHPHQYDVIPNFKSSLGSRVIVVRQASISWTTPRKTKAVCKSRVNPKNCKPLFVLVPPP